jgi:hypothetical protein
MRGVVQTLVRENGKRRRFLRFLRDIPDMNSVDPADLRKVGRKAAETAEKRIIQNTLENTLESEECCQTVRGELQDAAEQDQKYQLDKVQEL